MKDLMPWDEAREVAFECEPGTLSEKKIATVKEVGVTRLSLGIESFDDDILELNGRAHRSSEAEWACQAAMAAEFDQVNIDLIAGMMGETEANWLRTVEKTIALAPDMVTIYQMEIPYNTGIYREMKAAGKTVAPVASWATKRRWVDRAFRLFEEAGYTVTSAYTVVKDPKRVHFVYRDHLFGGSDILALGVASFGHIGGVHMQNENDIGRYIDRVGEGGGHHAVHRAYVTDPEERFVREFILRLKLGQCDLAFYRQKHGIDPGEFYRSELSELARQGFAVVDAEKVCLSRAGLLQIDRLLHRFFLDRHRGPHYA